jgi:hypothetical protein
MADFDPKTAERNLPAPLHSGRPGLSRTGLHAVAAGMWDRVQNAPPLERQSAVWQAG